ncbi:3-hydroxyisobutyrate dehydrogenase [Faunimonas pinastri]|uniref:3-hydroxyisobutyrate dehydrogenase n=1 Tax=Faunimonas pinastri TaxID=1855383 RepID=A0A1H9GRZ1_9HYPH|nr:NAD(P)-dependent oxidoreductase [Faunimonas pinastri]SEQ52831.1 3-hydroxyisobutyrate dehydrogenase [Faunimonas pinastri]
MPTIAIIAPGNMGAAVARRLTHAGARVVTSLAGRSQASRDRARDAGMEDVGEEALAAADTILSILPPGDAEALARRLAPILARADTRPLYADCNAVSPETVGRIGGIVASAGCPFVDVGIIGGPPKDNSSGPAFYASGEAARRLEALRDLGIDIRVLPKPVGAASALKMSYSGITKGLTALGAAMMLAAHEAGVAEDLTSELDESQPVLADWLKRQVPRMYGKAYRWDGEMEEIASFAGRERGSGIIYTGAARLYREIAEDLRGEREQIAALDEVISRIA